jgi:hypothetical protein
VLPATLLDKPAVAPADERPLADAVSAFRPAAAAHFFFLPRMGIIEG